MFRKTRGQSTVEYILLVTAVIGVMIFFLTNKNSGLQGKLNSTLDTASNSIGNMSSRLDKSHEGSDPAASPAPAVTLDPRAGFPK